MSLMELAQKVGWMTRKGEANKTLVNRTMQDLKNNGYVKQAKKGDPFELTAAGKKAAQAAGDLGGRTVPL